MTREKDREDPVPASEVQNRQALQLRRTFSEQRKLVHISDASDLESSQTRAPLWELLREDGPRVFEVVNEEVQGHTSGPSNPFEIVFRFGGLVNADRIPEERVSEGDISPGSADSRDSEPLVASAGQRGELAPEYQARRRNGPRIVALNELEDPPQRFCRKRVDGNLAIMC